MHLVTGPALPLYCDVHSQPKHPTPGTFLPRSISKADLGRCRPTQEHVVDRHLPQQPQGSSHRAKKGETCTWEVTTAHTIHTTVLQHCCAGCVCWCVCVCRFRGHEQVHTRSRGMAPPQWSSAAAPHKHAPGLPQCATGLTPQAACISSRQLKPTPSQAKGDESPVA